uniref:Eukaryotic translation initiation factor 5 n=1 Tax=Phallusia mammillata TaxID=59560 RepID=A0A6F9DB82_9ASCI|nr:eukaryotic translation initiation factor 5 [Phallusia mammillata]
MASVNVNREVQDVFYRYKMPSIIAKVEGKGNGVKTVIVNMVDIAKALGRPATYTCKFFGCELGAQTQFDLKHDRYIVNGSHESGRLQEMLDVFIKKFVLCQECDNPETTMVVKRGTIGLVCKACGNQSLVDLRHKLCTYIIKNPPQKDKKQKPGKERERGHSSEEEVHATNGHSNGGTKKTNGHHKPKSNGVENGFVDDGWSVDVSEEAVAARLNEISSGVVSLTMSEDLERTPTERANMLYNFVKKSIDNGTIGNLAKEILAEAERLDMRSKAPLILVELLCNANMREQIKTHRSIFLRICNENKKAQKALLCGFEKTVELHPDALLPKVAHIVKDLYDLDIIDEEVLIEWGEKKSKKNVSKELSKQIHAKAAPVVKWLKEAEEESSENEEDEIEIEYTYRAGSQLRVEDKTNGNAPVVHAGNGDAESGDDDLNIDDI